MVRLTKEERTVLARLLDGDSIRFSQDGDEAWFAGGDRARVGNEVISLRTKGMTERICEDEENYRGMADRDVISEAGRQALEAHHEQ